MEHGVVETAGAPVAGGGKSLQSRRTPLFVRIRTNMPAVLMDMASGGAIHGWVHNLSVGGMYFSGVDSLRVGERVICTLVRDDGGRRDEFHTAGTVVHRHNHGVGIAFDEVTPLAFDVISEMIADAGCFSVGLAMPRRRAPESHRPARRARPLGPGDHGRSWEPALKAA